MAATIFQPNTSPGSVSEVTQPVSGSIMHKEYVKTIGRLAYVAHGEQPQPPGEDKETNWVPAPAGTFSLYIRAYWGKQPILDGSWKPPKIAQVI